MPKRLRIIGLDDFGLTATTIARLGARPVHLSIQLTGLTASTLRHLPPKQRDAKLWEPLARQLQRLSRQFPEIEFVSRGKYKPSWTIDAIVPAPREEGAGRPGIEVMRAVSQLLRSSLTALRSLAQHGSR